ncbi:T9SS type A sorting domain-containing protein [Rufibacter soli]|jgi:hypothetical protein
MKIFTRVFLGILSLGIVLGSNAATLGVLPGGLPAGRYIETNSKSDTALLGWRTPASLTVTDFGILSVLHFPSYNPNAKKYSPFLAASKNSGGLVAKLTGRNVSTAFASVASLKGMAAQGVKEPKLIPSLNAYPNPSRGLTKISLSSLGDEKYKIRISNAIGKVYKEIPVMQPTSTETIMVDLSPLPAGVYFYSLLVNEKMVETKRLILQQQ